MPPRRSKINELLIDQAILDIRYAPFPLRIVPENRLDSSYIDWLLEDEEDTNASAFRAKSVGTHLAYTKAGRLAALAICSCRKVLLITDIMKTRTSQPASRRMLHSRFLSAASGLRVLAFDAHEVVLALHRDMNLTCARIVDLLSVSPRRDVIQTIDSILGARTELFEEIIREAFETTIYKNEINSHSTLAQQAWLAWHLGSLPEAQTTLARVSAIDSSTFSKMELDTLAQNMEGLVLRKLAKPTEETVDVAAKDVVYQGDKLSWEQASYGKRLGNAHHQVIKANMSGQVTLSGVVSKIRGRRADIKVPNLDGFIQPAVHSLTIIGHTLPTNADKHHALTILNVLQRKSPLFDDPWVKRLFPPLSPSRELNTECTNDDVINDIGDPTTNGWDDIPATASWDYVAATATDAQEDVAEWATANDDASTGVCDTPTTMPQTPVQSTYNSQNGIHDDTLLLQARVLNPSQQRAVWDMLDVNKDITMIQGPPGTGKTTVIAAYAAEMLSRPGKACLVIAESNVAIKNVCEKLLHVGIDDWILVVSSEFLVGWHEHLYERLPTCNVVASRDLGGPLHTRIVLCTISMLSNRKFREATRSLSMESVIVEEASQIPVNRYLPVLALYSKHIKKLTFIGDDKQLPPFDSDQSEALYSIFENKPLLESLRICLLDIQYRMPPAIGSFISKEVYSGLLNSWDDHPIQSLLAVQFLNVGGAEEPDESFSFKNSQEANTAIQVAVLLNQNQKSFKIITPYDSQRDLLEQLLRASSLPWENECFTVDSFQGNEEDFIIISIVRTRSVGFLHDLRRSNVMLSRAKKGMFICSNKSFLESSSAKDTLIGKMAEEWRNIEGGWIEDMENLARQLHIE